MKRKCSLMWVGTFHYVWDFFCAFHFRVHVCGISILIYCMFLQSLHLNSPTKCPRITIPHHHKYTSYINDLHGGMVHRASSKETQVALCASLCFFVAPTDFTSMKLYAPSVRQVRIFSTLSKIRTAGHLIYMELLRRTGYTALYTLSIWKDSRLLVYTRSSVTSIRSAVFMFDK